MTIERESAVLLPRPVPGGRAKPGDAGATIDEVSGSARIRVPSWIQPVGLHSALLLAGTVAGAVRYAVLLFVGAVAAERANPHGTDVNGRTGAAARPVVPDPTDEPPAAVRP